MDISRYIQGQYLKAEDLTSSKATYTRISDVTEREMNGDMKLIISTELGDIVCNKTNSRSLAEVWGVDSTAWIGCRIKLQKEMTHFQGKSVGCIRIYPGPKGAAVERRPAPPVADEDIPF